MKKLLILPLALLTGVLPASATITFTIEAETLLQGNISTPAAAAGSLVLFVASTTDSNFDLLTPGNISVGAFINGGDDLIVAQFGLASAGILFSSDTFTLSGPWTAGDPLAIYWIPALGNGTTTVGSGVAYGMYTSATPGSPPNSIAWITPPDPSTADPMFLTTTGIFGPGGNTPNAPASAGYSSLTTAAVPEPSTYALCGGVLALGWVIRRRFRA